MPDFQPTLYRPDGTFGLVFPKNKTDFQLKEMQEMVGGFIQVIRLSNGLMVVMDEEGKLKQKPINRAATDFVKGELFPEDYLVGNILICNQNLMK